MDQKEYCVMYDAEDSHCWYRGLHDLVCETDTLHPGTGRVIQRIQKGLGEADSENPRGGSPDLFQNVRE
jgi:hypothetical protein